MPPWASRILLSSWFIKPPHFYVLRRVVINDQPVTTLPVSTPGSASRVSCSSSNKPFGFARAPRGQHGPEGARRLGQHHLVSHALIRTQSSFGGEEIRSDVRVLVCRTGGFL